MRASKWQCARHEHASTGHERGLGLKHNGHKCGKGVRTITCWLLKQSFRTCHGSQPGKNAATAAGAAPAMALALALPRVVVRESLAAPAAGPLGRATAMQTH